MLNPKNKFYEFLENANSAIELADDDDKDTILEFIKCSLTDKARQAIRNRDFPDWASLKAHLKDHFCDRRSQGQYQLELNTCKQKPNEPVSSYSNRIETILVKLKNSLDDTLSASDRNANCKLLESQAKTVFVNNLFGDLGLLVKS